MCVSDNQGSNENIFKYNDTYARTTEFSSVHRGFMILAKQMWVFILLTYYTVKNATFSPQLFGVSCDLFPQLRHHCITASRFLKSRMFVIFTYLFRMGVYIFC